MPRIAPLGVRGRNTRGGIFLEQPLGQASVLSLLTLVTAPEASSKHLPLSVCNGNSPGRRPGVTLVSIKEIDHRLNLWALYHFPFDVYGNTRFSYYSAQPTSEKCINN